MCGALVRAIARGREKKRKTQGDTTRRGHMPCVAGARRDWGRICVHNAGANEVLRAGWRLAGGKCGQPGAGRAGGSDRGAVQFCRACAAKCWLGKGRWGGVGARARVTKTARGGVVGGYRTAGETKSTRHPA